MLTLAAHILKLEFQISVANVVAIFLGFFSVFPVGSFLPLPKESWLSGPRIRIDPGGSDGKESACNVEDPSFKTLGQEDPLEKMIATHSSVLAWRIPWMEEPGGL